MCLMCGDTGHYSTQFDEQFECPCREAKRKVKIAERQKKEHKKRKMAKDIVEEMIRHLDEQLHPFCPECGEEIYNFLLDNHVDGCKFKKYIELFK